MIEEACTRGIRIRVIRSQRASLYSRKALMAFLSYALSVKTKPNLQLPRQAFAPSERGRSKIMFKGFS